MASVISIRKAFEAPLKAVVDAYTPTPVGVRWPDGRKFDASEHLLVAHPRLHMNPSRPRTLGPAPLVSGSGLYRVTCGLQDGQPVDLLDAFVDAVIAAYPFDSDLIADGRALQVEETSAGEPFPHLGRETREVDILWSMNI
jgi:hypothetical protein